MVKIYNIRALPHEYFNRTYKIFCFDLYNGREYSLTVGNNRYDAVIIAGLDRLDGEFVGDEFIPDINSYNLFVDFLKSIHVDPSEALHNVALDVQFAKDHYFVDVTKENKKGKRATS